jgi:hypothetical protein
MVSQPKEEPVRITALALGVALLLTGCPSGDSKAPAPKPNPNPGGSSFISAGNRVKLKAAMMGVLNAAKAYKGENGKAPASVQDLVEAEMLTAKTAKDLWGNDWLIVEEGPKLKVVTYGSDGKPGGTGPDKDWSSDDL